MYFLQTYIYRDFDEKERIYTTTYYKKWRGCYYYVTRIATLDAAKLTTLLKECYAQPIADMFSEERNWFQNFPKGEKGYKYNITNI